MSFAQLVAHFNQKFQRAGGSGARTPFALEEGAVVAGFYGMRLESAFEPFLDAEGRVIGHQAQLHAYSPHGNSVSPWAPYAVALDEDSIVDLVYQVLVDDSIYTSPTYAFYFTGEVFQYAGYDPEWVPTLVFTNPDLHFHHQPGLGPYYIDLYATKIE